jgi:hypothetical protein
MLGRPNNLSPARPDASPDGRQTMRALHNDLLTANDEKIRQIVGLLDNSSDGQGLHIVLDPLRPRLAALRPVRPLRFARLLFIPLSDLLVPARNWKPGQATIPRSILKAISSTVRAEFGDEIDCQIDGHDTSELDVVASAGASLWGRAGRLLALAPPPVGWADTGLPETAYAPLARAIATVLRRAVPLQALLREAELGVLQPTEKTIGDIVSNMADEPVEGRVLVLKLILQHCPHAGELLRRLTNSTDTPAERALLQKAMEAGVENILTEIEDVPVLTGSLSDVASQIQRLTILLKDLNSETDSPRQRARLRIIREKMNVLCRDRFIEGMQESLFMPLSGAPAPVDAAAQRVLENCARDLRSIETIGRKLGSGSIYDASLADAGAAVEAATDSGTLTCMRAVRLVEILSGAEQAEKFYYRKRQEG